jgi:signal transduction histidine kinase
MDGLAQISARVDEKKQDYARYDFTKREDDALKAFFDLAQEFDRLEDLYRICVAVPKAYFGLDTRLYLLDNTREALVLVCTSNRGYLGTAESRPAARLRPREEAFVDGDALFTPIRGKVVPDNTEADGKLQEILGLLEVSPSSDLSAREQFYFQKYANRIGYALYNRLLSQRNIEHLRFINTLVADIEHNVIVPNMIYRLFLRRLHAKMRKNKEIETMLAEEFARLASGQKVMPAEQERILEELREVNQGLMEEYTNIDKHYRSMSLFLESLFRRDHFKEGRFILRKRRCNFKKEVVDPQLERLEPRFRAQGITIDNQLGGVPDEAIETVVDVGLISQVYANLFSNALKYTRPAPDTHGSEKKFIAFGREFLRDYFGPGEHGVKFNVFSTGPHIPPEEREFIFNDGFRGKAAQRTPGTGHGLNFVKNVVEMHGGVVGYEPTHDGNNIYFVLPT